MNLINSQDIEAGRAKAAISAMLFEMKQVEKALQRLELVIPPEYEAFGREAKVIQESMTQRRLAIEAIKGSAISDEPKPPPSLGVCPGCLQPRRPGEGRCWDCEDKARIA